MISTWSDKRALEALRIQKKGLMGPYSILELFFILRGSTYVEKVSNMPYIKGFWHFCQVGKNEKGHFRNLLYIKAFWHLCFFI